MGLHAGVALVARDRQRLERLCRYVARTAIAASRLSALDDGRLLYRLKKRWRDGTTHIVFEPVEFIAKLAALIPAPRVHLVRYHGVLAPGAPGRGRIVPQPDDAQVAATPCVQKHTSSNAPASKSASSTPAGLARTSSVNQRYYSWAELMRRVFEIDVLPCPRCQGPMKILAQIHPPETTRDV
ncbi:MAG: transposase [Acidobacteriota bacterium]